MELSMLKKYLLREESTAFQGWDFSYLEGRWRSDELGWDYREVLHRYLTSTDRLLDMGTGGGEFLLELGHPHQLTAVTEGYAPNVALCRERLEPLGIQVEDCDGEGELPFPDASFDVVANRHESFDAGAVWRVLRSGGYFVTQQVGGENNRLLSQRLIEGFRPSFPNHDLAHNRASLEAKGFTVLEAQEAFVTLEFLDLGAVAYFAKLIPWEFPGFSVEQDFQRLLRLQQELEETGIIVSTEHRFLLVGRK